MSHTSSPRSSTTLTRLARMSETAHTIHTDGASHGNPGPAGIGYLIEDPEGNTIREHGEYIGVATNNVAEYRALIAALEDAHQLGARTVHVISDSELMVKQLRGTYRVKNANLQPLHAEATRLLSDFDDFRVEHALRSFNVEADRLAGQAVRDHLAASDDA